MLKLPEGSSSEHCLHVFAGLRGVLDGYGRFGQSPVPRLYQPINQTTGQVNDAFFHVASAPSPGYLLYIYSI